MLYAKFLNEREIELAPAELLINARKYVGFTKEFMASQGYKPVMHTFPEYIYNNVDEEEYELTYTDGDTIRQEWKPKPKATT